MEKIVLNEQNKEYVRNYYVNRYLNNIECNDLDVSSHRENIEKFVDDTINEFLKAKDNSNFSDKMSNACQKYVYKYKIKKFGTNDIFMLAKKNPKYFENLYKHYENYLILNIVLNSNKVDIKTVEQAKILLKESFNKINILDINDFEKIRSKIGNISSMILLKLNIKTNMANSRNNQIAASEGSKVARDDVKKHFKSLYLNKIDKYKSSSLLSKEKLEIYIADVIDNLIENYFNNNASSSVDNYLNSQLSKILKKLNNDIVLIKYARIVNSDDDYNYAVDYYAKKYEYILDEYNKNFGVIEKYKELIEEYVRNASSKINIELYLKKGLNEYVKRNTIKSISFDLVLARGNNEIERQRHRHILLTEFEYKIASYKKDFKFYDEEKVVDEELRKIYVGVIDSYINGVSNNPTSRYLSTLLKQRFESYSKSTTKGSKYIYNILLIILSYLETLEEYYNANNLSYTEKGNLEEYMGLIFNEYIENGCYKDDHKGYFRKMIENYESIDKSYVYEK